MGEDWTLRVDEPTPNGGAYAEIIYYDRDGHRCKESDACTVVINECDKKGRLLKSTYCMVKR